MEIKIKGEVTRNRLPDEEMEEALQFAEGIVVNRFIAWGLTRYEALVFFSMIEQDRTLKSAVGIVCELTLSNGDLTPTGEVSSD